LGVAGPLGTLGVETGACGAWGAWGKEGKEGKGVGVCSWGTLTEGGSIPSAVEAPSSSTTIIAAPSAADWCHRRCMIESEPLIPPARTPPVLPSAKYP
jgi:hypothetical protein